MKSFVELLKEIGHEALALLLPIIGADVKQIIQTPADLTDPAARSALIQSTLDKAEAAGIQLAQEHAVALVDASIAAIDPAALPAQPGA